MKLNTEGLYPHPARCANAMPIVKGTCPSCELNSLFLGVGGYVTCSNLNCENPLSASNFMNSIGYIK